MSHLQSRRLLARSNRIAAPCSVAAVSRTYAAHGETGISNGDSNPDPRRDLPDRDHVEVGDILWRGKPLVR